MADTTNTSPARRLERRDMHLLIVDDDDRIRELLRSYLNREGFRASSAASAAEARNHMAGLAYDLLILDVMMPGEDGLSLLRGLREGADIPVILLTAQGETSDRIVGLKAGADDYISKPFDPEELVLRIESIFRRSGAAGRTSAVTFGTWHFDLERRTLSKAGEHVGLTTGEEALLSLLARRAGAPVSRQALSEKITARTERAVDVQITRLRKKLEINPAEPQHILTVRGLGYRLVADAS